MFGIGMSFIEFFNLFIEKLYTRMAAVIFNRTSGFIENLISGILNLD